MCGVHQGSILGPLLFLLYINDLSNASNIIFSILFADDSNMFLTGKDPNALIRTMNQEMKHVVDWLKLNKLSLNLKKTHFVLFRRKQDKVHLSEDLIVDNAKINMVNNTKFLGVFIDEHLSFQKHIKYIKGKVSRATGVLYKCRPVLNENTLKVLYNTIVYPYFTYCIEVWGNTYSTYIEPLIKAQKRAIRTIVGAKKFDHTTESFKKLKLLNITEIYVYFVQLFMFKFYRNMLPHVLDSLFTWNYVVHSQDTRQRGLLHVPLIRTFPHIRTIRVTGVRLFNHISKMFDMKYSYDTYKRHLKNYIFNCDDVLSLCKVII